MARKPEKAVSPEGAPRLRAEVRKANTIGEAMAGGGAGQAELDWVLNPANFAKAKKMLKGGVWYFFPAAGDGEGVPCVFERDGRFWRYSYHRGDRWDSHDRVVVSD